MNLNKHWKEYTNPDYIGAYTFLTDNDGSVTAQQQEFTITAVEQKEITGDGGKRANKVVATLKGQKKQMVFNATNSKKMIELYGDECMFPNNWVGKTIVVNAVRLLERGKMEWRMRIVSKGTQPTKAKSKPAFTPEHKNWAGAKKAIAAGNYTIEQFEAKYTISAEHKKELCGISE